jgi:hypothetical protein
MICSRALCGALAVATLAPAAASAQQRSGPYAGLFGRAPDRTGKEFTAVQFRTTSGAQIGQTLHADFDQAEAVPEGLSAGADATLSAEYLRDRVQAIAHGRYAYQEYRQSSAFGAPGFDAGGSVNYEVTTRFTLHGGAQFIRSPFFSLMWLAPEMFGPTVATPSSTAMLMMKNDSADANAGFTAQLGRRTSLIASAFTRQTTFASSPQNDFATVGGRSLLKHQLTRSLAVRAGYEREELRNAPESGADNYVNEILDVGVEFAKAFSMGRRTMFSFTTETSMVRQYEGAREFRLNGTVGFERRFQRTWITQLSAIRATEFVPGFIGPVFTDRGRAVLAGYLAKRLLFDASAEGGQGAIGHGAIGRGAVALVDTRRFISYTGNASLTFGLTRHFGVFGQYVYYHYQMPPDPLALVTVQHLSRQAVSIGVKTWVSIIDKEKVPRDPR